MSTGKLKTLFYSLLSIFVPIMLTCILIVTLYAGSRLILYKHNGEVLAKNTSAFERSGDSQHFLLLGDSLAYGVGTSSSEHSLAGLLAEKYPHAHIENRAKIGNDVEGLLQDIVSLKPEDIDYDGIFVLIGGNDIMRYGVNINESAESIQKIIDLLSDRSAKVYVYSTVDFKNVKAVTVFLRSFYSKRSDIMYNATKTAASQHDNVVFVDAYHVSSKEFSQLQASDGFHLNDTGTRRLFDLTPLE